MVRKSLFKYILFALLMVFLFVPSVKAATQKWLECEYKTSSDAKTTDLRIIYKYNQSVYVLDDMRGKKDGKWKMQYDSSILSGINQVSTSCHSGISIDGVQYTLRSGKQYETEDLKCEYTGLTVPTIPFYASTIPRDSYASLKKYLNSEEDYYNEVQALGWSEFSQKWYFLQKLSEIGCPRVYMKSNPDVFGRYYYAYGYENVSYNSKIYFTNAPRASEYENVYRLTCPSSYTSSTAQDYYNSYETAIKELNAIKNSDISKIQSDCKNQMKETCTSDQLSDYIENKVDMEMKMVDALSVDASYLHHSFSKIGCDEEDDIVKETTNKLEQYVNTINEIYKDIKEKFKDILSDEAIENMDNTAEELVINIDEFIKQLFSFDDSELEKLAENKDNQVDCTAIFGDPCDKNSLSLMCFITVIFNIIRYLIPAILIILGSIDFAKVVVSNEREAMSKALSTFIKRVIVAIVIFFLPLLIKFLLQIFGNSGYSIEDKINCVIESLAGDSDD